MSARPFTHEGLLAGPLGTLSGDVVYAEVVPAGTRWLPWPGRTSRWWYEVHSVGQPDEHGIDRTTHAYRAPGSGGGFTLAACLRRALQAVEHVVEELDEVRGA